MGSAIATNCQKQKADSENGVGTLHRQGIPRISTRICQPTFTKTAVSNNRHEVAALLQKYGVKFGSIHVAARAGDAEAVKELKVPEI
jgi:hypothetical protein